MGWLRNNFWHGVIMGLLVPVVAFLFWWLVNWILLQMDVTTKFGEPFQFSLKTRLLLTLSMNIIPTNWAKTRRWDNMMRGIGIVTIIMMLGWVYYYYSAELF